MDLLTLALALVGLVLLVAGAELLVRGASSLAATIGISPLVVGLTVVAFGTSAPELAVSLQSAASGQADLAFGNVVGSNICNVLLILGLSAAVAPLVVHQQLIRVEVPLMIGVSFLVLLLAVDGGIGRLDGVVLATGAIAYTVFAIRQSRKAQRQGDDTPAESVEVAPAHGLGILLQLVFVAAGLGLLVLGARWLVAGAVAVAQALEVSELVIGLTVVAAGTSLPELATSVMASYKGERDIAVGNVVGSNLFNLLAVLGFSSALSPEGIGVPPDALAVDLPVMIAVAVACLPIFFTGNLIARWEGALFLAYYVAYTVFLVLTAQRHEWLPLDRAGLLGFILPLTAITEGVIAVREWRQRQLTRS
ncbi:MAG TPA: calcium/sodium antiporter [Myxococcaceae bacterium]|nr:calcium/sodium antiporter [Myxococcaceae bacterium]